MNLFKALGVSAKTTAALKSSLPRQSLPELHSFVDIEIAHSSRQQSTSIDRIDPESLSTRPLPGLQVGADVALTYANSFGRFRFLTACIALDSQEARFAMPSAVTTLVDYGSKRGAVRVASMIPIAWRYASGGVGMGDFVKGTIADLSRTGAFLVVDPKPPVRTQFEMRFALNDSPTLTLQSEVVRAVKILSGKNAVGIRFLNVDGASEQIINEFIHERQTQRRQRGMV